jgi:hypothetical protein
MTRFQMTRRFLTPRVFEGSNLWERAIKGYINYKNYLNKTETSIKIMNFDNKLCHNYYITNYVYFFIRMDH